MLLRGCILYLCVELNLLNRIEFIELNLLNWIYCAFVISGELIHMSENMEKMDVDEERELRRKFFTVSKIVVENFC